MSFAQETSIERWLKRDRLIVAVTLGMFAAFSWIFILSGAGMDTGSQDSVQPAMGGMMDVVAEWTWTYAALVLAMWWVMMMAMMLPSAAPTILIFTAVFRQRHAGLDPYGPTGKFVFGYLATWGAFSLGATALQWGLEKIALLSPMMEITSLGLGAGVLIAAGTYQMTPLKYACLERCRTPLEFVATNWRDEGAGAFKMGLKHGVFCLGCCWVLMALLFYGGVMNLWWIGGLTIYILTEKLVPYGHWISRFSGIALVIWGVALLYSLSIY